MFVFQPDKRLKKFTQNETKWMNERMIGRFRTLANGSVTNENRKEKESEREKNEFNEYTHPKENILETGADHEPKKNNRKLLSTSKTACERVRDNNKMCGKNLQAKWK